jgi:hypothetical protein
MNMMKPKECVISLQTIVKVTAGVVTFTYNLCAAHFLNKPKYIQITVTYT